MTRNERIDGWCNELHALLNNRGAWVSVAVRPGHEVTARFVTLDPRDAHTADELILKIKDAVAEVRR